MAKGRSRSLRIYCLCGQRMKVSEAMYGQPGKCIACRQKIRIPRQDEIDPEVTELYLKDHPEFLRKSKPAASERSPIARHKPRPAKNEPPPLSDERGRGAPPPPEAHSELCPLDVLEPLRMLCTLDFAVRRRLAVEQELAGEETGERLASLREERERIARARVELDQDLRQRLVETEIELSRTEERAASMAIEGRVGEVDFLKHHDQLEKLRWRRNLLERRRVNLMGWLAVKDPYLAGGMADVAPGTVPESFLRAVLPADPEEPQMLMQAHVDALRAAFEEREAAERRLDATRESRADRKSRRSDHTRQEAKAIKRRADAAVRFHRGRLERLWADYGDDLRAVEAQLDRLRGNVALREMGNNAVAMREAVLNGARNGLLRSRDLLGRALSANSARDVPQVRETLHERPVGAAAAWEHTDSWAAWGAALLTLLALVTPMVGNQITLSLVRGTGAQSVLGVLLFTLPLVGAFLFAAAGFLPSARWRGITLAALAFGLGLPEVGAMHEIAYSPTALGAMVGQSGPIWLNPAPLLMVGGVLCALIASALTLRRYRWGLAVLALASVSLLAGSALLVSDFGGLTAPRLSVEDIQTEPGPATSGMVKCAVAVRNIGPRRVLLSADPERDAGFRFELESRGTDQNWQRLGKPMQAVLEGGADDDTPRSREGRYLLMSGERAVLWYWVQPGMHRVRVLWPDRSARVSREFEVEAPVLPAPVDPSQVPSTDTEPSTAPPASTTANNVQGMLLEVQLSAILTAEARQPKFSIIVYMPSGEKSEGLFPLSSVVYGPWHVREYNPSEQTVTLATDDNRLVILRKGVRVPLN